LFNNKRRCIAVLLSIFILSGSIITAYDKAYASDIIIGGGVVVTTGEAIAFLLGAFGLTAASAAVYANSDSIKAWGNERLEAFKEFSHGQTAITQEQFDARLPAWLTNAQNGIIDTSSVVWDYWKQWAGQLTTDTISHAGGNDGLPNYAASFDNTDIQSLMTVKNFKCKSPAYVFVYYAGANNGIVYYVISLSTHSGTYGSSNTSFLDFSDTAEIYYDGAWRNVYYFYSSVYLSDRMTDVSSVFGLGVDDMLVSTATPPRTIMENFIKDYIINAPAPVESEYALVDTGITDVYNRDKDYAAVDWVNPGAVAGATDVVIDWGKVGDMATVLEGVAEGVLDPADILDDAGVTVIDKVTDKVIDNTGVTDIPVTDVVVDTSEIGDYTMPGLESLFPFCLPFDLIAFIKVLQAEPVAPHFKIPIKYPTLGGTMAEYEVDIDFSAFDTVAALLRDMECLLFIVGLIILTRDKMIRG
jgi:hypothetical protein